MELEYGIGIWNIEFGLEYGIRNKKYGIWIMELGIRDIEFGI